METDSKAHTIFLLTFCLLGVTLDIDQAVLHFESVPERNFLKKVNFENIESVKNYLACKEIVFRYNVVLTSVHPESLRYGP